MGLFDKVKNLFTEEVEEEPIRKEIKPVEVVKPSIELPDPVEEKEVKEPVKTREEKFVFFTDDDFKDLEKPKKEEIKKVEKKEEKRSAYNGASFKPQQEVKKEFKPSPIISPVYGVLDKNYKKDDIVNKAEPPKENKTITLDDVRNKAYGTLEDELESTLFGRTAILFQNNKKDELEEIEKDLKETADAIDMITEEVEAPKHEKKEKKTDQVSEDMSENDLFNLIDDMYGKGDM